MSRSTSQLFPGVAEALRGAGATTAGARGLHQQAGSARPGRCWQALGLLPLLRAVGGGDSFPVRKPDPAICWRRCARPVATPERAVMLGDHPNDVVAARGAGMPCIFAAWGYGPLAMAAGAAAVAQSDPEMAEIARRLLADRATSAI